VLADTSPLPEEDIFARLLFGYLVANEETDLRDSTVMQRWGSVARSLAYSSLNTAIVMRPNAEEIARALSANRRPSASSHGGELKPFQRFRSKPGGR
jgi:hypothetical protein